MVWHFIGVYIINRTLHDRLEIRNFSSRVEKYFTRSLRSLVKYFSILEEKFRISARPCNILYLFLLYRAPVDTSPVTEGVTLFKYQLLLLIREKFLRKNSFEWSFRIQINYFGLSGQLLQSTCTKAYYLYTLELIFTKLAIGCINRVLSLRRK